MLADKQGIPLFSKHKSVAEIPHRLVLAWMAWYELDAFRPTPEHYYYAQIAMEACLSNFSADSNTRKKLTLKHFLLEPEKSKDKVETQEEIQTRIERHKKAAIARLSKGRPIKKRVRHDAPKYPRNPTN